MPKNTKSKVDKSKKSKDKKQSRSRSYMYSEAIGCLPVRWLDQRYKYEFEEWDVQHADDTNVIYYKNAVLNLNAIEDDLNERLPEGTEWAMIVHDKEYAHYIDTVEEKGDIPKAALEHIHISIYYPFAKTVSAVRKDLGLYDSTKEKFIENFNKNNKAPNNKVKKSLFSYLPHWTESARADKFDYGDYLTNRDKCRSNFNLLDMVKSVRINIMANDFDKDSIIEDILEGRLIEFDFHKSENLTDRDRALRTFYVKNKTALDNAFKNRAKALSTTKTSDDIIILFFGGGSGSGKTNTAIQLGEKNYKTVAVTGGENDFLQNYMGQECLIIDDARPTMLSATDWLKMIDPSGTKASVKSRYFNKTLNVKCIIITSILPFEEFFVYAKQRGSDIDEPVQQFIRRLTAVIEVAPSSHIRQVLQSRQTGTRMCASDSNNFRIAKEDRATKYTVNYENNHKIEDDIADFENDYDIENILKDYDNYAIGRIYAVKKSDVPSSVKIPKKNEKDDDKDYEVDRKLVEYDHFAIGKLKDEKNENKLDSLIF